MKFWKLNAKAGAFITAIAISAFAVSCNDSDKSAKNSTDAGSDTAMNNSKMGDSSSTSKMGDSTTMSTTTKKRGKASTAAMTMEKSGKMQADANGFYNRVETAPVYPGGQSALEDYINNNIEYPDDAVNNSKEGTVNVKFTIDETGHVSNVQASGTKQGYGMDEEAVRIVSGMPSWTPGMIKGKNVKGWYTLPITYKLD